MILRFDSEKMHVSKLKKKLPVLVCSYIDAGVLLMALETDL